MKNKVNVTLTLPPDLMQWLNDYAWDNRYRISPLLRQWVQEKKEQIEAEQAQPTGEVQ